MMCGGVVGGYNIIMCYINSRGSTIRVCGVCIMVYKKMCALLKGVLCVCRTCSPLHYNNSSLT